MTSQVAFALALEFALVVMTSFLLVQPRALFGGASARAQSAAFWAGLISLCVTFCWSVVVGCVLFLHQLTLRI